MPVDEQFTGQRLDSTGLYFYNARYYDPSIGRFISADTLVPSFANPQAFNRYSYVYNNPLKYTDPSGHWGIFSLIGAAIGAVVNTFAYGIGCHVSGQSMTMSGFVGAAVTGAIVGAGFGFAAIAGVNTVVGGAITVGTGTIGAVYGNIAESVISSEPYMPDEVFQDAAEAALFSVVSVAGGVAVKGFANAQSEIAKITIESTIYATTSIVQEVNNAFSTAEEEYGYYGDYYSEYNWGQSASVSTDSSPHYWYDEENWY